ncbi:MAG: hypothetical protein V4712_15120 [Pseudomonadota bacterium]
MTRDRVRPLFSEETRAPEVYAAKHGRNWKSKLRAAWMSGGNEEGTGGVLRSLRNTHGPSWLFYFRPETAVRA